MIEIEELKNGIRADKDYLKNIKLMVFDMDGVLLKNRNSWDIIIHRSMKKIYLANEMKYTFDYLWHNGLPDNIFEELTETKIKTYLNLNDLSFNVLRTMEYLKNRKIKTAIVSAGSQVFAGYLSELLGIDYYTGNEVDVKNHNFIKNVDPATKDLNVKKIQERYGISQSETVSVGDSYMDLSMKKRSKYFVAFNPSSSRLIEPSDFFVEFTDLYGIIENMVRH
ncbi:HAD family hydrolase [Ferroplasma sp.]|uniref:HAD family hydrolase n=1 Tax=Ferroplasma sp. TaxID=2591003 RepID=UPI00307D7CC5